MTVFSRGVPQADARRARGRSEPAAGAAAVYCARAVAATVGNTRALFAARCPPLAPRGMRASSRGG